MSPFTPFAHDIPHSPPLDRRTTGGKAETPAIIQARLNEIARRDPQAVLGVLGYWLGLDAKPQSDESR